MGAAWAMQGRITEEVWQEQIRQQYQLAQDQWRRMVLAGERAPTERHEATTAGSAAESQ
jgi:hypothetical protein